MSKGENMKYLITIISLIFFFSCGTQQDLLVSTSRDSLEMIGGKRALLDDIVYPARALQKGIEGEVKILAYIDTAGTVRRCEIVEGNDYLNDAAVDALKKQRFNPYTIEGQKRPVQVIIPILFTITQDLDIREYERRSIVRTAEALLRREPDPITRYHSDRSPGGPQVYYSEGRSWWPQEDDPGAAYLYLDGRYNPDAFRDHADALAVFGETVPALTAAYRITGKEKYAEAALTHVRAWFINETTRMEPHLQHAQAIPNRTPGRDTGIYEGLHLAELVRSLPLLETYLDHEEKAALRNWFREYAGFLLHHEHGISVRERLDVYGNAWLLQVSVLADYLGDKEMEAIAGTYYRELLLPALAGASSPLYHNGVNRSFSDNIFLNADLLAMNAQVLSGGRTDLWQWKFDGGRSLNTLISYMHQEIIREELKTEDHYRGRFLSLLFAGLAYENNGYLELWRALEERFRENTNPPLRQPVLWTDSDDDR